MNRFIAFCLVVFAVGCTKKVEVEIKMPEGVINKESLKKFDVEKFRKDSEESFQREMEHKKSLNERAALPVRN